MSVHTQHATQTQIVDNSTLDLTLTLVYIMTRRLVHKHFDHYHLLITYGKFHMFGYSRLHIDIYPGNHVISFAALLLNQ